MKTRDSAEKSHLNEAGVERSIAWAIDRYIHTLQLARSPRTAKTYQNALNNFRKTLAKKRIDPGSTSVSDLSDDAIGWFAEDLKGYSPATETLYLTAAAGFYDFLAAEELLPVNLPRIRLLIHQRSRRAGQRLPQFPRGAIDELIEKADHLSRSAVENKVEELRNLRDLAFFYTLADTGLRVHEACNLRRGDIDWFEYRAIIIGKGNREAVVRFSERSLEALKRYLSARSMLDGSSGKPLSTLPLFARHDRGAGQKVKPITTTTGRNIVTDRVRELLGKSFVGKITPHSFRHYFVTRILQASGNLKLAQELARHRNIAVTQRYAHLSDDELDKGYWNAISGDKPD